MHSFYPGTGLSNRNSQISPGELPQQESISANSMVAGRVVAKVRGNTHVKRPRNCFMIYLGDFTRTATVVYETRGDLCKAAAKKWKSEDSSTKEIYKGKADQELAEHKIKYPDYKYQPRKKNPLKKKINDDSQAQSDKKKRSMGCKIPAISNTVDYKNRPLEYSPAEALIFGKADKIGSSNNNENNVSSASRLQIVNISGSRNASLPDVQLKTDTINKNTVIDSNANQCKSLNSTKLSSCSCSGKEQTKLVNNLLFDRKLPAPGADKGSSLATGCSVDNMDIADSDDQIFQLLNLME